jgi:hypothetical protein
MMREKDDKRLARAAEITFCELTYWFCKKFGTKAANPPALPE